MRRRGWWDLLTDAAKLRLHEVAFQLAEALCGVGGVGGSSVGGGGGDDAAAAASGVGGVGGLDISGASIVAGSVVHSFIFYFYFLFWDKMYLHFVRPI